MRAVLPEEASSSEEEEDIGDEGLDAAAGLGPCASGSDGAVSGDAEVSGSGSEDDGWESGDELGSDGRGDLGSCERELSVDPASSGGEGDGELSGREPSGGDSDADAAGPSDRAHAGAGGAGTSDAKDEQQSGPFKSQDKGAAIAKAFAKVTHGRTEDLQEGAGILASSKSVLKRQREEAAAEATDRKARHLRQEMRRRGHAKVPRRGEDPAQDAAEKLLLRTARRGVVTLFNAVSKAQRQVTEQQTGGIRGKAAQLTKADFLAELRGKAASLLSAAPAVKGGVRSVSVAVPVGVSASEQAAAPEGPAWDALRDDDFAALSSGLKMKDWDKREEPSDVVEEVLGDAEESDSD